MAKESLMSLVVKRLSKLTPRDSYLRRTYGITEEEYEKQLDLQGGVCWICLRPPVRLRLAVDHKHQKGERQLRKKKQQHLVRANVRGLVCHVCNRALALLRDSVLSAHRASVYLGEPPFQKILQSIKEPSYG